MRSVVVLPQPDGPRSTTNSPFPIVSETSPDRVDVAEAAAQVFEYELSRPILRQGAPWHTDVIVPARRTKPSCKCGSFIERL